MKDERPLIDTYLDDDLTLDEESRLVLVRRSLGFDTPAA